MLFSNLLLPVFYALWISSKLQKTEALLFQRNIFAEEHHLPLAKNMVSSAHRRLPLAQGTAAEASPG